MQLKAFWIFKCLRVDLSSVKRYKILNSGLKKLLMITYFMGQSLQSFCTEHQFFQCFCSSWLYRMDKYLIKRPWLSAELPRNPPGLCDAADDLLPRHNRTSAPSMDTLGAINATTADTQFYEFVGTDWRKRLAISFKEWGCYKWKTKHSWASWIDSDGAQ